MDHFIVYCSPSGSTRHVSKVITERLQDLGQAVNLFDLGNQGDRNRLYTALAAAQAPLCLWIGSPVYVDHPVPPVMHFINALPAGVTGYAVVFVTWGAVSSGTALLEMGRSLSGKGFAVIGAAKVVALHSLLWRSAQPLGIGHPDARDDATVSVLVDQVHTKLSGQDPAPLPLEILDYLPAERKEAARGKNIAMVKKMHPEWAVDPELCVQCGECQENCPADAITLAPYPEFGDECFACFSCARTCSENAIILNLSSTEERIRSMAAANSETPLTQIFS